MTLPVDSHQAGFRPAASIMAGAAALTSALWVAISAAAPEFIWRGGEITLGHLDMGAVLSALLIGLILAFFVEPLMRRLQMRVEGDRRAGVAIARPRNALFTAFMGFAFAFASVCVHDAMIAFVSAGDPAHVGDPSGVQAGIALTVAWAIVPFATTLAWMSAGNRWLKLPLGAVAAASPGIAGWLFGWTLAETVATVIPCLVILGLGYREIGRPPLAETFARCARRIAPAAAVWLVVAAVVSAVLDAFKVLPFPLYSPASAWMDARFYLGWMIGLLLAPFPVAQSDDAPPP